jgi:hypothetical protein
LVPIKYGIHRVEDELEVLAATGDINTKISAPGNNYSTRTEWGREDISEIRTDQLESIESEYLAPKKGDDSDFELPTKIFGPASLRDRTKYVLNKHRKRFRITVGKEPAHIEPFELKVDDPKTRWNVSKNKLAPRRLDKTRQFEMNKIIMLLVTLNVIQTSKATHYSHPFVVPKPGKDNWRLVLDYKNLNAETSSEGWPIPNIRDMIYRIGATRPKYFIVMDLTSGYHQAPVSRESRELTAFITQFGVYEWLRLPMGLKGAPSYFQRQMQDTVLHNLCMNICEVYLDDCIIFAESEDELIERLETVLERFEKFNITVNPKKCVFGLEEVVCVGHTINEKGHSFTQERLDGIMDIPKPETQKALKMFMGVVGYVRDSIRDFAKIAAPLNFMLHGYTKARARRSKLEWCAETNNAFDTLKLAVHDCPLLWFIDDTSPIILYTDASDYGIGAYLCQVIDGLERPIAFISKTLVGAQKDWDTGQKEGFAIFYALNKWEYLLRDRKFLVRTDHDNLTMLKQEQGHLKKVRRWFTVFQSYDIDYEHWPGEDNIVADGWSRLCFMDACEQEHLSPLDDPCIDEDYPEEVVSEHKIPRKLWNTIKTCHNSMVGHCGIERTVQKVLASEHSWPHLRDHVKKFIQRCPCCQKMSVLKIPIHTHPFTLSKYQLGECVYIDYIEKLLPDEAGNDHIIVMIDAFSRWVELYPVKGNTSENTAQALLKYFARFGRVSTMQLVSDNGQTLVANIIKEVAVLMGLNHTTTMAYSKEENAMVERVNKEVVRHLKNMIFDKDVLKKWSVYLPLVQRIINVSKHSAIGVSPAQILHGDTIDLSIGFLTERLKSDRDHSNLSRWTSEMLTAQSKIVEYAKAKLSAKDLQHIEERTPNEYTSFIMNSLVLVEHRHNSLRKGPKSKLLPFLKGPMKIIGISGDKYTVECLVTNTPADYHISQLRPFYHDPTENPLYYALRDDKQANTYHVNKITNMRGDPKGSKKDIWFEVFWTGYDVATWEPWKEMRNTSALQIYLSKHTNPRVKALAPKKQPRETVIDDNSDTDED